MDPYGSFEKIAAKTPNPTYGGFKGFATKFNVGAYLYDGFSIGNDIGTDAYKILISELSINKKLDIKQR